MSSNSGHHYQDHLSTKLHQQKGRKKLLTGRGGQKRSLHLRKITLGTLLGTLLNSLAWLPAAGAQTAQLGVVKSLDNNGHWPGISQRLLSTGVDYCIVDLAQVEQASDLGSTQLLFLPNIELLKPTQLAALRAWMDQGGRLIVSGPMGTLSQPEVRQRLRSLLGAYWGFALTKPSALEPLPGDTQNWVNQDGLVGTILGGAVIPADTNSATAAVWSEQEKSPAVITTDKSTFFGWRWGLNSVASVEVDSAWLRAALERYGISPSELKANRQEAEQSQQYCISSQAPTNALARTSSAATATPEKPLSSILVKPHGREQLTGVQVTAMGQELENLIGRFESALLAANATNSDLDLQTSAAIEQFIAPNVKEDAVSGHTHTSRENVTKGSAHRALTQARTSMQSFRNAIAQKDYREAREQWIQARRTLWDNYPLDRQLAQPEIRAIWLDRGTIVKAKSERDLVKIFDQLAAAGFNTVFFETVNASYPIYPSRVAPEQNPLVKGWDPLEAAVKLAHERGMELHAWVWIFAAANQRHNTILNQPASYPGPVLKRHPDWANVDQRGRSFHPSSKKAFLDPANPEVRRYLTSLLEEIIDRYDVDGIQLDYIRYPFQDPQVNQTYGYGKAARQQFKEMTGVDPVKVYPDNRKLWQQWTDFRTRQIDSFVASVSARLREKNPQLILSAAVFATPRGERLQRLQQNWEDWASRGDLDLIVPMTYALDTNSLQNLAQPVLTQPSLSSTLILPAIRLLNLPNVVAIDQIQLLRDLPAGGYALFAAENLNTHLQNIFHQTQGQAESANTQPVPYRQPFPAAAARYAALQQEWTFLLAHRGILVQEPALSEWGTKADELSRLLNQLAQDPSKQNLLLAKISLSSFRSDFQKWMQQQAIEQAYQVQVWDNRLATIDRLLRYGERAAFGQNRAEVAEQQ
ncbi:family 10 glycosylhydrolase [Lyngbya aestuarii]|uniref:family 10 glycosylhydrolase n=1 Tax=Lyngbya aestuarii TaxID=118322 RepID=UPI00403E1817